ncbi:MAG: ATP-binding protein [Mariprofundaceae bacterium]|nr:ATP-binding protein [Mariprofundaceae bacterium]
MLAGITGNLYLLKATTDSAEALEKVGNIEQLSFRAAEMIKQLLAFARKDRVDIKPLSFTSFSKETLRFLRTTVPENIEIYQNICADDLQIKGDATQLHQVLMNLVGNARDALDGVEAARLSIRLDVFEPDEDFMAGHESFKPGRYAHLSVEDNGCGIPKHRIKHLFEPFYTTKEQGKGTGLGLAMVFGAIQTHQGYVDVQSVKGEGTIFHIYIPLLEQQMPDSSPAADEEVICGQSETILLVDDDRQVRETTAEVLEAMGYKVLLAVDGLEALAVFKAHQHEISLAILDVVMPRCGGAQLAGRIREIQPDLPIIFATGYDKEHVLDGEQIKNSEILSKPFQLYALSRMIHSKLNS